MKAVIAFVLVAFGMPVMAQDVVILGEVHDNPAHHRLQAEKVAQMAPKAIVFEMITRDQAVRATDDARGSFAALDEALGWTQSGWPDFAMYYPIFAAAPEARIYGAFVPGSLGGQKISDELAEFYKQVNQAYDLSRPLPPKEQAAREALQKAAHCDALPEKALPGMVAFQRQRDAVLAEVTRQAVHETGGPVAVITGNGHARRDWGVPALLAGKAPELDVLVIGQTEDDQPINGGFDQVLSAASVERPDPCLAFR